MYTQVTSEPRPTVPKVSLSAHLMVNTVTHISSRSYVSHSRRVPSCIAGCLGSMDCWKRATSSSASKTIGPRFMFPSFSLRLRSRSVWRSLSSARRLRRSPSWRCFSSVAWAASRLAFSSSLSLRISSSCACYLAFIAASATAFSAVLAARSSSFASFCRLKPRLSDTRETE